MTPKHGDRTGDTLLTAALLLLLMQAFWQLFEVPGRGRLLSYAASLAAFLLLLAPGLIAEPVPRPRPALALLGVLLFLLAITAVWHLIPGGNATEPSRQEIARLVLTRYLFAFEWSAITLAIAWQCLPSASNRPELLQSPDPLASLRRINSPAAVVLGASLIAGAAFVIAAKQAGIGPSGPAAAVLLVAIGLATAAVCQRLGSGPDA